MRTVLVLMIGLFGAVVLWLESERPPPAQTFVETDFIWDDQISPHKDVIIATVNEIHRKIKGCQELDPTSAYLSNKSTPRDPVFFVTCGSGANMFNVWFSRDGIL